jgi:hypothetical protein
VITGSKTALRLTAIAEWEMTKDNAPQSKIGEKCRLKSMPEIYRRVSKSQGGMTRREEMTSKRKSRNNVRSGDA